MRAIALIFALCCASTAAAQGIAPATRVVTYTTSGGVISPNGTGSKALLSAVALNGAASTLTVILPTAQQVSKLEVDLSIVTDGGLTAVTSTMSCSKDGGSSYISRTTVSCATGTCTLYKKSETYSPTTGDKIAIEYDVRTCTHVKIVLNDVGGDAGDTVTLNAQGVNGL